MIDSIEDALAWARTNEANALARFCALLRMPSISNDPAYGAELQQCAEWLCAELAAIGLQACRLLPTAGPPVVYGEWLAAGKARPTVLIYAHYDVMPVEPLAEWGSPPFVPTVRDRRLYARGALDDKCGVFITLAALEAMLRSSGRLPVNVKVIFEGEEECGSPHIGAFVAAYADLLRADLLVVCDGSGTPEQPLIMTSTRGTVDAEVIVRGPPTDLHSGAYGGVVHNPIHLLSKIIAALHDEQGRILIPGFYDRVQPLRASAQALLTATEPLLLARARQETGHTTFWAEALGTYGQRATALPTCDVNGIWGGYQGPGGKTIIPAQAGCKVSLRIVPEQEPQTILDQVVAFIERFAVATLTIEVRRGAANWPATLLHDGPVMEALQAAYRATWGKPAQRYRVGGAVPLLGLIQRTLQMPLVDLGLGVGGNVHAPNEYLELDYFGRGIATAIHFYHGLAAVPRALIHSYESPIGRNHEGSGSVLS